VCAAPIVEPAAIVVVAGILVGSVAAAQMGNAAPPAPAPAPVAGYDDHFFLQDGSGRNRLTLGALLQVHGSLFERGSGRESDFFLRRFRLEIGGQVEGFWRFNLEPKFTSDDFEFEEAWIGFEPSDDVKVMIGRMKEPFSLEEMISLKHLATVNLSILNQFVPAEGHGLTLQGRACRERVDWGAAVYRGGADGLNGGSEGAARLVLRPWGACDGAPLRGLQFGASATYGRAQEALEGDELKMEAREPFATFEPGAALDGDRTRVGAEAAWVAGPVQLLAEAVAFTHELEGALGSARARTQGWYGGAAWVVTGEERTFKGVRPARPFLPRTSSGPGAVELAGRWSRLHLSDHFVETGALAAGADPGRVESLDLGVNWYATWRARVKLHWLLTRYDRPIDVGGGPLRHEQALLLQFHLHF